jgi:NADH dehydrogenase (ubiquinone) 1 beta subcomplex subunit 9
MSLPFSPQHRTKVMLLYRSSLKLARDWIAKRDHYRIKALEIRQQFELNSTIANPREVSQLIKATELKLYELRHPDPYIPPTRPGGTKYDRYVAPVLDKPLPYEY